MHINKKYVIAICLIIIISVLIGALVAYVNWRRVSIDNAYQEQVRAEFSVAGTIWGRGDFRAAHDAYQKIANDESVEQLIRSRATQRSGRSQYLSGEREEGANQLKRLFIQEPTADSDREEVTLFNYFSKTNSIIGLSDMYYQTLDKDFATNVIFAGDPFAKALADAENNVERAWYSLYKLTNLFNRIVVSSEYKLAEWHMYQLLNRDGLITELSTDEIDSHIYEARKHLRRGDSLYAHAMFIGWPKYYRAGATCTRAEVVAAMYAYGRAPKKEADSMFKKCINLYASDTSYVSRMAEPQAKIRYAGFKIEFEGANGYAATKDLIDPIVANYQANKEDVIYEFLYNLGRNQDYADHYIKRKVLLVARYAPGLKDLLVELGWDVDMVNASVEPIIANLYSS